MPLKPVYTVDGRSWMPIGRAAKLIGTNTATVKRMMGDGRLEWRQNPNGLALLVEETGVLALRRERGTGLAEVRKRAAATLTTADQRGTSMAGTAASRRSAVSGDGGLGVFDKSWDPAPVARPALPPLGLPPNPRAP
jgi:hypothetical protein